jgi:hypothetical protein
LELATSQVGVTYELINMKNFSSVVSIQGTGSAIQFNTGPINETTVYRVQASNNGCSIILNQQFVVTVNPLPDSGVIVLENLLVSKENNGTYRWLDCTNSSTPIPGQTQSVFAPTKATYFCHFLPDAECSTTARKRLLH